MTIFLGVLAFLFVIFMLIVNPICVAVRAQLAKRRDPSLTWATFDAHVKR